MIVTHKRRSEPDLLPAKRDQNLHERKHDPNDSERDHVDPPGAVGMVFGSAFGLSMPIFYPGTYPQVV